MDCSLEMTVYLRQINKQAVSARVVDFRNPDSISSSNELSSLYWCKRHTESDNLIKSGRQYEDIVLRKITETLSLQLTKKPFEHSDNLLHNEENKLSIAEQQFALDEYEKTINPRAAWITEDKWKKQGIMAEVVQLQDGNF